MPFLHSFQFKITIVLSSILHCWYYCVTLEVLHTLQLMLQFQKPLLEARMVAVNETSGAAVAQAGGSPNSKDASPTKVEEQR